MIKTDVLFFNLTLIVRHLKNGILKSPVKSGSARPPRGMKSRNIYIFFQGVRSRSRDISTSLSRTSGSKFLRLECFKMVHAKYC